MTKVNHDTIKALSDREKARDKVAIWFGSKDNYYHPVKEVIANATDELINNFKSGTITVTLQDDNKTIKIQDTGRGIPVWGKTDGIHNYDLLFTTLFAGTKYDESTTTGTNGVGNTVTNYTSTHFLCISGYNGFKHTIQYKDGGQLSDVKREKSTFKGTIIEFRLDPKVYTQTTFNITEIKDIVNEFAIASANTDLKFVVNYKGKSDTIVYPTFKECFETLIKNQSTSEIAYMPAQKFDFDDEYVDIELVLTTNPETFHKTYLNLTYLSEGGSIHNGVVYGIREYMNDYCLKNKLFKKKNDKFLPSDIENSVSFMVNMFNNVVEFQNQTKLSTQKKLYREVALNQTKLLLDHFRLSDKENFDKFTNHLLTVHQHNEKNQRETRKLRDKLTKEIKPITNRVEKLVDCKQHGLESELFITEGESAKGSIVQARDGLFQAAYPLRGKILNCLKAKDNQIFKNETITDLIKVLGCGIEHQNKNLHSFDESKLRYGKIIIACFPEHTKVRLLNGTSKTFTELIQDNEKGIKEHWVYASTPDGKIMPAKAINPRKIRTVSQMCKVYLDNGNFVECTPDHHFLTRDGKMVQAQHLQPDRALMPLHLKANINDFDYNRKVTKVEIYDTEPTDVYCMTVEKYHNFAIETTGNQSNDYVFVKNCDQDPDGFQIACLVLTMFYKLMPTLLQHHRVYIAQTPLYQVKTVDDEILYMFNDQEKEEKLKSLKSGYTISRNKGLGQTSSDVLYDTALNPKSRHMINVTIDDMKDMEHSLMTWLGDGVNARKDFISNNLNQYLSDVD